RRRVLANSLKTSNAISLPGITSLNRSGFDAIILYHFDAAELAPSTASKADICGATSHVRFTPNCDRKSGYLRFVMSALPPRADMCSALAHVRFGPKSGLMQCSNWDRYPITSSVSAKKFTGSSMPVAFALEVDDEPIVCRLHERQISRPGTA